MVSVFQSERHPWLAIGKCSTSCNDNYCYLPSIVVFCFCFSSAVSVLPALGGGDLEWVEQLFSASSFIPPPMLPLWLSSLTAFREERYNVCSHDIPIFSLNINFTLNLVCVLVCVHVCVYVCVCICECLLVCVYM